MEYAIGTVMIGPITAAIVTTAVFYFKTRDPRSTLKFGLGMFIVVIVIFSVLYLAQRA